MKDFTVDFTFRMNIQAHDEKDRDYLIKLFCDTLKNDFGVLKVWATKHG